MIYLTPETILARITQSDLDYLTGGQETPLNEAELDAISEIGSYLTSRYDTDAIFAPDQLEAAKFPIIKRMLADILLYNLHSSANPRNIPEFRIQRRDDAISWLKKVSDPRSNVSADFLPLRDFGDRRGNDLTWNSKPKRENYY